MTDTLTGACLSAEQIDHFKTHGFVILRGFIDDDTLGAWRDQFWTHIGADRDDGSTWPDDYVVKEFNVEPRLGQLPQMLPLIDQLGGGMFAGGGGSMLVQWPKPDSQWQAPQTGHIDGYGPGGWGGGFMLGATTYLEDVEPGGGGFYYWPDSHLPVAQYFREHPEQIDGSFRERDDWEERTWGIFSDDCDSEPREFTGAAGDLILWHCYLCHTGSPNVNARPRQGVFARWHRSDNEQMKWDVGGPDLWKYWSI
jgi:hypothetical protein